MKKIKTRLPGTKTLMRLAAALCGSLFLVATLQAQSDLPIFNGNFTLDNQVRWGTTVLQPGDYSIVIGSSSVPNRALVRDSKGRTIGLFLSRVSEEKARGAGNALLLMAKGGQLCVYSVQLGNLRMALTYDPALAREAVLESRATQTVPMMLARR